MQEHGRRQVVGESSPYYMFHPLAPARIAERLPDVKLIVLLRDPVDRAYSHYQHMRFEGLERCDTFEEALDREAARLEGEVEKILTQPGYESYHHRHHAYTTRGVYAEQIEHLQSLFPPDRLLVLDFLADPSAGLQAVLSFLGLGPFEAPIDLKAHNAGRYADMEAGTRERLVAFFAPHNERLYGLLGVDFGWSR
jgi:Sulfotransferase domain